MKLITRSAIALVFLVGLATPLLANPNVAVRIRPVAPNCFLVQLTNLQGAPVAIQHANVQIFDENCKRTCISRRVINQRVDVCKTFDFRICCPGRLPARYICYVQVFHANGRNEGWFFRP